MKELTYNPLFSDVGRGFLFSRAAVVGRDGMENTYTVSESATA
jgi:hypothetical protein